MDEQWNSALDQVADEFLVEAARYRKKRPWPGVITATAAVLVLAAGWTTLHSQSAPTPPSYSGANEIVPTEAPEENNYAPSANVDDDSGNTRGEGFWGGLLNGSESTEQVPPQGNGSEQTPYYDTQHFTAYQELKSACLDRQSWYLHRDVMVPYLDDEPLNIEDITVFEKEMYGKPWVWYYISHQPHITVRIPTAFTVTAGIDPNASGAEALRQISPDAPNLHNQEAFAEHYSEIREVQITTSEGTKIALLRQEAERDRVYLSFLQNGTFVTIAGPQNAIEGNWLETFALIPIDTFND